MGFFRDLFAPPVVQPQPSMPVVTTGLPQKAINEILSGRSPTLKVTKVALKNKEVCLFYDRAVRVDVKLRTVGHQRTRDGFSVRIVKGLSYRTGNGLSMTIRDNVAEYQEGKLYITNQRIIFSASAKSFSKKMSSLVSYNIEDNYLLLQFDRGNYCIYLPIIACAEKVMEKLI